MTGETNLKLTESSMNLVIVGFIAIVSIPVVLILKESVM
jgi:hypothetical protein